ncbi:response regulator [Aquimarina sp. Aq107]|uniref:response regulator n=1 Tax=Aquimarina sp. Aq107 TaxID=1191912 RepID=UPI000D556B81|nr:response regulator [Aquimarina sp. Aq107]
MVETVLLIDDDKATQYIHKRIITKHNDFKNVLTFLGGDIALTYLKSINVSFIKKPQLIFVDLNMPSMNGWEFIEAYNKLGDDIIKHSKLMILTTSSNPNDISRSKTVKGVSDYIVKPLSNQKLDHILKTYFVNH